MKIVNVNTQKQLKALYNSSALTWEGMVIDENNLNNIKESLSHYMDTSNIEFWITEGKFMNEILKLTGDNAYPEKLHIVSCMNVNIKALLLFTLRFSTGGRWFDDIVDNNTMKKEEIENEK